MILPAVTIMLRSRTPGSDLDYVGCDSTELALRGQTDVSVGLPCLPMLSDHRQLGN
jgi:hypothetical protein